MSSWIASLWYTCLSPLTIKKVSPIGAKTNQHLSIRTTSVPFTINLCTRYGYSRNLLSSASGDRAHFHWSVGNTSREGETPTPKQQAAIFLHPPTGSSGVSGALQSSGRFLWNKVMHTLCMINFLVFQLYILIFFYTTSQYEQVINCIYTCNVIR